jgi:hypothetical protein
MNGCFWSPTGRKACCAASLLVVSSCAAASRTAEVPGPLPDSHVSGVILDNVGMGPKKFDVTGRSFASVDPATKMLTVKTFSADTQPTPGCADMSSKNALERYTEITLYTILFPGKPGRYDVATVGVLGFDPKSDGPMNVGLGVATGTHIDIKSFGAHSLIAEVTSVPGALSPTTASIAAAMCPYSAPVRLGETGAK